jgi:glucosylceramidase
VQESLSKQDELGVTQMMSKRNFLASSSAFGAGFLLAPSSISSASATAAGGIAHFSSDGTKNWIAEPMLALRNNDGRIRTPIVVDPTKTRQTIEGFGGAFNEKGWEVLTSVPENVRDQVVRDLFTPGQGLSLTIGRTPMGASDYAMDAFSYSEVAGDYELRHFSTKRDEKYLLPYLQAALRQQPNMHLFASPWTPPSWMKANNRYDCKLDPENGHLIFDDKTQKAYAKYFELYVKDYTARGVPISAIHFQNEVTGCQIFPSSVWTGEQSRDFLKNYLIPQFKRAGLRQEMWMSTINDTTHDRYAEIVLSDPALAKDIAGIGYQWDGQHAIAETRARYPTVRIWQTESECGDGSNDRKAGFYTFSLMRKYFNGGANAYVYWNMVLEPKGPSTWGWQQNSLITIDRRTKGAIYNFEYYVFKHMSALVKPGAKLLDIAQADDALAFKNPDGQIVIVLANTSWMDKEITVTIGNKMVRVKTNSWSLNSLVVPAIDV